MAEAFRFERDGKTYDTAKIRERFTSTSEFVTISHADTILPLLDALEAAVHETRPKSPAFFLRIETWDAYVKFSKAVRQAIGIANEAQS